MDKVHPEGIHTVAQAGAHPGNDATRCQIDSTATLRLRPDLGMGPGLRRGDTVGVEPHRATWARCRSRH